MTKLLYVRGRASGPQHIFIATPSYDGKVCSAYTGGLVRSLPVLEREGIGVDYLLMTGNCHVDDARNGCLREFLKTDCTDLVFIDADVGWDASDLLRLCLYDRDVVAGVYPKKTPDGAGEDYPVHLASDTELRADANGLLAVEGAPTGFMRIKRHVIEKLVAANAHRRFVGQNKADSDPYTIVFERTYADGHRWSGDYAFCRAWAGMGGKIYVDPEMRFVHEGEKEWSGCLGDFLRREAGIYHPALIKGIERLKAGEANIEVFDLIFRGWSNPFSAAPDLLLSAYLAVADNPGDVLETGSGISTIIMGIAADATGKTVHALEHDLDYFQRTWKALEAFGIQNVVLHYAPLRQWREGEFWYDVSNCVFPDTFGIVLCDGPQRRWGRNGLFALLGKAIAPAHWLMDDCDNAEQLAIIETAAAAAGRTVHLMGEGARKFAVSPALKAQI